MTIISDESATYYLRSYIEKNGKVTYYKEIEVNLYGQSVYANLEKVENVNIIKAHYILLQAVRIRLL